MDEKERREVAPDGAEAVDGIVEVVAEEATEAERLDFEEEDRRARSAVVKRVVAVAVALLILIGGGGFGGWNFYNAFSRGYCMTFEGKRVDVEDFKMVRLMIEQSQEEAVTEDDVISWLVDFMIFEKAASDYNFMLTPDEQADVDYYTQALSDELANMGEDAPRVTDERIAQLVSRNYYQYKLYEMLGEGLQVTDQAAFDEWVAGIRAEYPYLDDNTEFQFILTETRETGEEVLALIDSGETTFEAAARQYSLYFDEENGVPATLPLSSLAQFMSEEAVETLQSLSLGMTSDIIMVQEGEWLIFRVSVKETTPADELLAQLTEYYLSDKQYAAYEEWLNQAKDDAVYKVNQKAVDLVMNN